jgi:hypothetical protein
VLITTLRRANMEEEKERRGREREIWKEENEKK